MSTTRRSRGRGARAGAATAATAQGHDPRASAPRFPSNGLTLVSLFAGCGGSGCGYHLAGYDVRLAVEWDQEAAGIYAANFPGTPMHAGDIKELSSDRALELARVRPGELDVLDGSPPCQGFSTAGKRVLGDRRNVLFLEFVRMLAAFRPRAFVMENVSGLRKGKMKLTFAEIHLALKAAGYRVACRELNAWWYGVPQDRRRLIWVGLRDDLGIEPSHPQPTVRRPVTVAEALGFVLAWPAHGWFPGETREHEPAMTLPAGGGAYRPRVMMERRGGYRGTDRKFRSYFREGAAPTLACFKPPLILEDGSAVEPLARFEQSPGDTRRARGRGAPPPAPGPLPPRATQELGVEVDVNRYKRDGEYREVANTMRSSQRPRIRLKSPLNFTGPVDGNEKPAGALLSAIPPKISVEMEVHPGYRDAKFRGGPAPTLARGRRTRIRVGSEQHSPAVLEKWAQAGPGENVASFQSPKLDPGKPAPTAIAGHRAWSPSEPRYITVPEAKVLQGFPEWFDIEVYWPIGNSVPPPLAEAVGRHVAGLLGATSRPRSAPASCAPSGRKAPARSARSRRS